jgi:hypothetical protein
MGGVELLIARNPDPDSRLPFLLRISGTWPRTTAPYRHPASADE